MDISNTLVLQVESHFLHYTLRQYHFWSFPGLSTSLSEVKYAYYPINRMYMITNPVPALSMFHRLILVESAEYYSGAVLSKYILQPIYLRYHVYIQSQTYRLTSISPVRRTSCIDTAHHKSAVQPQDARRKSRTRDRKWPHPIQSTQEYIPCTHFSLVAVIWHVVR
jgi:hypothetical protein